MDEYNNYENGYNQNPPPPRRPQKRMNARWLWIIPVLILVAILAMDSFYTLKEDQYAVLAAAGVIIEFIERPVRFQKRFAARECVGIILLQRGDIRPVQQ